MSLIQNERERDDAHFIRNVESWPRWPVLPVVGRNDRQRSGIVHCGDLTRVYVVNLFEIGDRPGKTFTEQMEGVKMERYASIDELVRVWTVD